MGGGGRGSSLAYASEEEEEEEEEEEAFLEQEFRKISFDQLPPIDSILKDILMSEKLEEAKDNIWERSWAFPQLNKSLTSQTAMIDRATELAITNMLRYSLERADRNLRGKEWFSRKAWCFFQDLPSVITTVLFWAICAFLFAFYYYF